MHFRCGPTSRRTRCRTTTRNSSCADCGPTTRSRSTARSGWARRPRSGCSVPWAAPEVVRPHDTFLSAVHWSWFLVPHGTMLFVLLRHHDVFARNAVMMAATFDLGCVVYWLVPTAPPWWAGSVGKMPHVRRIMTEAGEKFWRRWWKRLYDAQRAILSPLCLRSTSALRSWLHTSSVTLGPGMARWGGRTRLRSGSDSCTWVSTTCATCSLASGWRTASGSSGRLLAHPAEPSWPSSSWSREHGEPVRRARGSGSGPGGLGRRR